jgi:neopullulanase
MPVPPWVQDAVFYQVFPDRFANGDLSNDPPDVWAWGSPPTISGFQGGDLRGLLAHLDYLTDLGVTALYLNPIFCAASNHRYDTTDYRRIDDRLGSLSDFTSLVDAVHRRGLKIILDGVFNHTGRGFAPFQDLLDHEDRSAYRDWYHVLRFPLDAFGDGPAERYKAWWNVRSLPKLNTSHPPVRRYLLDVARRWIERGADGWRLDVPNEIDDDLFWEELRHVVRRANPDAYLLGEIWTVDPRWVGRQTFDGLMNYPLRAALLGLAVDGGLSVAEFRKAVEAQLAAYPEENVLAQYNLLGSHDTERVATLARHDADRLRLLFTLQFFLPGVPGIYYGDEIGLAGGKDPDSRAAFPWNPSEWDMERRTLLQRLIALRRARSELRQGQLRFLDVEEAPAVLALARAWGEAQAVLVANVSESRASVRLSPETLGWGAGREVRDVLSGRAIGVGPDGLSLELRPMETLLVVD